jgi:hypothetical protein
VTIYDALGNVLNWSAADEVFDGSTITLTVPGVSALQTYYVQVMGADMTAFGTGRYALTLNMGTGSMSSVPLPNTQTANGNPISGSGGLANYEGLLDAMGANDKIDKLQDNLQELWNKLNSQGTQQGVEQPLPAPIRAALYNGHVSLSRLTGLLIQQLGGVSHLTAKDAALIALFVWEARRDGYSWA